MNNSRQLEKIISSLNQTMDDTVTFSTKEINFPGTCLSKLELVLDVLLISWRRLDQVKVDAKFLPDLLAVKEEWLRQISHFDMIQEKFKSGQLFDHNEQLINLSILLHKPYLKTTIIVEDANIL